MFYFTSAQIDEIERRLAVRAKKDTDFDEISEAQADDLVAIIHNGRNMICRLDQLPGSLVAKRYNDIPSEITEETILEAPTAFSISVIKSLLGIETMPEFDDDSPYEKGDYVCHIDDNGILRGYLFTDNKTAGYWDDSKVEEINYKTLLDDIGDIFDEFKSGGRVYILESYFTDGKANRALADEDGKNIKEFYALKTDIPEIIHDIEELIAGKVDKNTLRNAGNHSLPVYFNNEAQPETIDSLDVPGGINSGGNIHATGGVSANGYSDLGLSPGGGSAPGTVTAIAIDDANIVTPDLTGIVDLSTVITDGMEVYNPSRTYKRGESFYIEGSSGRRTPYRVLSDMSILNYGSLERLTLKAASEPLSIGSAYIQGLT